MGLDRLDRDLHHRGDFLVLETLFVAKSAAEAHLGREIVEGGVDLRDPLLPLDLLLGRGARRGQRGARAGWAIFRDQSVQRVLDSIPLLRSSPPELILVDTVGDAKHPPFEARFTSKGIYSFKDPQKDVLGEIPAFLGREAFPFEIRENPRAMELKKPAGIFLPVETPLDLVDQVQGGIVRFVAQNRLKLAKGQRPSLS